MTLEPDVPLLLPPAETTRPPPLLPRVATCEAAEALRRRRLLLTGRSPADSRKPLTQPQRRDERGKMSTVTTLKANYNHHPLSTHPPPSTRLLPPAVGITCAATPLSFSKFVFPFPRSSKGLWGGVEGGEEVGWGRWSIDLISRADWFGFDEIPMPAMGRWRRPLRPLRPSNF